MGSLASPPCKTVGVLTAVRGRPRRPMDKLAVVSKGTGARYARACMWSEEEQ